MRPLLLILALLVFASGCAHTYYYPTGFPADVAERFFFHLDTEARDRGLRTTRSETDLHVYAQGARIWYQIQGDEISAALVIANRKNATSNYYKNRREELETLNEQLIAGARRRAKKARDFAY